MKQIKFYSIIILAVLILILAFENIGAPVTFLLLFSNISAPMTIPILIIGVMGTMLGWIMRSYLQDLKDEKENEEMDGESTEKDMTNDSEGKDDEVMED